MYLFRGCLIPTRLPYLESSSRFVIDKLGLKVEDLPGASCCVEPIGLKTIAEDTWVVTVARMLAIAERDDKDILALCNGCYLSFVEAIHELRSKEKLDLTNQVLADIGLEYKGNVKVNHILDLVHSLGKEKVDGLVTNDMSMVTAAPHTGCHILRPSGIGLVESPYAPRMLAEVARWTGAKVAQMEGWPECCGGGVSSVDESLSSKMLERISGIYRSSGANCIVTPCPFCFSQFDLRQKEGLPVLYISELLALAMGAPSSAIGLKYHRIKTPF
jgi:heterodisulfide reductase subunit B2